MENHNACLNAQLARDLLRLTLPAGTSYPAVCQGQPNPWPIAAMSPRPVHKQKNSLALGAQVPWLYPLGSQEQLSHRMDTVDGRNTGGSAEASPPFQLLLDFSAAIVARKPRWNHTGPGWLRPVSQLRQ